MGMLMINAIYIQYLVQCFMASWFLKTFRRTKPVCSLYIEPLIEHSSCPLPLATAPSPIFQKLLFSNAFGNNPPGSTWNDSLCKIWGVGVGASEVYYEGFENRECTFPVGTSTRWPPMVRRTGTVHHPVPSRWLPTDPYHQPMVLLRRLRACPDIHPMRDWVGPIPRRAHHRRLTHYK